MSSPRAADIGAPTVLGGGWVTSVIAEPGVGPASGPTTGPGLRIVVSVAEGSRFTNDVIPCLLSLAKYELGATRDAIGAGATYTVLTLAIAPLIRGQLGSLVDSWNEVGEYDRMDLDAQTIRDIELLQGSAAGQSLFDFLDRTRTVDGRRLLRQRFIKPAEKDTDIVATQEVVRHLTGLGADLMFPLPQTDLDHLRGYLDSNYEIQEPHEGLRGAVESRMLAWRHADFISFARRGIRIVLEFLERTGQLMQRLATGACPRSLRQTVEFFRQVAEFSGLQVTIDGLRRDPTGYEIPLADTTVLDRLCRRDLKSSLLQLLDHMSELDGLMSMARATLDLGFTFPEVLPGAGPVMEIDGLCHPFVAAPVRNDCRLGVPHHVLFLTGPNMAGKTTFMKALGVAVLLAQIGMGVPATHMRLTPVSRIYCSLNAVDDIRSGLPTTTATRSSCRRTCSNSMRPSVIATK